jgi:S-formylglutathione hydrolase FrmB
MAFATIKFHSVVLGGAAEINVIIPQCLKEGPNGIEYGEADSKYKCLYLLHGLGDDNSTWYARTSIERYANKYGICVVMPSGDKSFYTDMKYGDKYYTYIAQEVPTAVRRFFNVSEKREDNFIAGNSMGGYGALKVALRECDSFCAVAGLSACADIKKLVSGAVYMPIFGEDREVKDEDDILYLADLQKDNPNKPRVFIGIGTEDFLYENNKELCEKLKENGYDFTYQESEGTHNWDFWDKCIQDVLKWMFE